MKHEKNLLVAVMTMVLMTGCNEKDEDPFASDINVVQAQDGDIIGAL